VAASPRAFLSQQNCWTSSRLHTALLEHCSLLCGPEWSQWQRLHLPSIRETFCKMQSACSTSAAIAEMVNTDVAHQVSSPHLTMPRLGSPADWAYCRRRWHGVRGLSWYLALSLGRAITGVAHQWQNLAPHPAHLLKGRPLLQQKVSARPRLHQQTQHYQDRSCTAARRHHAL